MKKWQRRWYSTILLCIAGVIAGTPITYAQQEVSALQPRQKWTAEWISHPTAPLREPAVFHFRRILHLDTKPPHFIVEVSADNRFRLFVNGIRAGEGPARGDLAHWRYETLDLAPELHPGKNILAAEVWNYGIYAPLNQISDRSAFLMQGNGKAESIVNTDATWQVEVDPGISFIRRVANGFWFYYAAVPGERMDGHAYDWGWKQPRNSASSHWVAAAGAIRESIYPQTARPVSHDKTPRNPWMLISDTLPQMEFRPVPAGRVVRTNLKGADGFPIAPVTVPPHTTAEILLDRGTMITGYPELEVSGGNDAHIEIGYTEALYDRHQLRGNRNDVGDRSVLGLFDEFLPDGGSHRDFMPLWFRTWRYLQLKVQTGNAPLTLDSLHIFFSAFPFKERASFTSSDPELERIWKICWRTARLDAHDTYMDTPFWERLQYIEDTRIQALISYIVAGDDRLARQALHAFDDSRVPDGLTQSRYPSRLPQFIPNFSLRYVDMLHDYWMYRPDDGIVRQLLPGTRCILEWFFERQYPDGFLKKLPYWGAIDSPEGVKNFPRMDRTGRSALVTLIFVEALQNAAKLEDALGDPSLAVRYRRIAAKTATAVYKSCWNAKLGLLADTPEQDSYSQHTNIFGILTDTIPAAEQPQVMRKLIAAQLGQTSAVGVNMAMVSYNYQFYLSRAIDKTNLGQNYLETLAPWRKMLALGLTTTPEYADPTRSDTHAWSAHPIYDLLTIVAGIHPAAPGFARVRISPHPGGLTNFDASMPHPQGLIRVGYRREKQKADLAIDLPGSLIGKLEWNGRSYPLHSGSQTIQVPANRERP